MTEKKTTMPPIIGLYAPYPRMGKSTVARFLSEAFGYTILKFSHPIKAPLYQLGLTEVDIEGAGKEHPHPLLNGLSPRQKMHALSQDLFKTEGENALSERMKISIDALKKPVVIDDVRFESNYALIKSYPLGQVWRIASTNSECIDAYDTRHLENHVFDLNLTHPNAPETLVGAIREHLSL